jgi:hypothetical protein
VVKSLELCFSMYAGEARKRDEGIDTGWEPAVFVANWTLDSYEHAFVDKLIAKKAWLVLANFQRTSRYIDDLNALLNRYLWLLRYTHCKVRLPQGTVISGIYEGAKITASNPEGRGLTLTQETNLEDAKAVTILDARIRLDKSTHLLAVEVHDKREESKYDFTAYRKYPPANTLLQHKISHLIVYSQCHRTHTIASSIPAFTTEIAAVLHELLCQGHQLTPLLQQYVRYLQEFEPMYPATDSYPHNDTRHIYEETKKTLQTTWAHGLGRLEIRNKRCGFPSHIKVKKGQQLHWPTLKSLL